MLNVPACSLFFPPQDARTASNKIALNCFIVLFGVTLLHLGRAGNP